MAQTQDASTGTSSPNAQNGSRKRKKVEREATLNEHGVPEAINESSKEDRKLAKKARRSANRTNQGPKEPDHRDNLSLASVKAKEEFSSTKESRNHKAAKGRENGGVHNELSSSEEVAAGALLDLAGSKQEDPDIKATSVRKLPVKPKTPYEANNAAEQQQAALGEIKNIEEAPTNGEVNLKAAKKAVKEEKRRLKALKKAHKEWAHEKKGYPRINGNAASTVIAPPYIQDIALSRLPQADIDSFLSTNFISITDPSTTTPLRPIIDFSLLPVNTRSKASPALKDFKTPTPIQATAWPFLLSGRDLIGIAETGSGKTLAFGVPCVHAIKSTVSINPEPQSRPVGSTETKAVIVSPTRELAVQIHEQIKKLVAPFHLSTLCIYGGVPKDPQRAAANSAHIIVATPGRLNDLIEEGSADLSEVKYLVLDEADRMLDKGFEDAIRKIISHCPSPSSGRQTLMFTATWPPSVRDLAGTFMVKPVHIAIGDNNPSGELRANKSIVQKIEVVEPEAKQARLLQLIKQYQGKTNERILVFCLYKKEAVRIEGYLQSRGLRVAAIHGDLNQQKRMESLEAFKSGSCPLLVATDVAARGLDIPSVKLVLNVTFPLTVEDYVHRIGRTGRAGAQGLAITLFTVHDKAQSGALINVLRAAGQEVPEELLKFGTTVKKKTHETYGAFVKDLGDGPKVGTKTRFD